MHARLDVRLLIVPTLVLLFPLGAAHGQEPVAQSDPDGVPAARDEFDIDEFIESLNPPTVEEIIASLESIPTLEELLAMLDKPAPPRPVLPEDVAARVGELEGRIAELATRGLGDYDQAAQDAALAEALGLAKRVLAIRSRHQSGWTNARGEPAEWYEVADARRAIMDLKRCASLSAEQRAELRDLSSLDERVQGLYSVGEYEQALVLVHKHLMIRQRLLGDRHPDVATSLNSLAKLYYVKGNYAAAESLYSQALAMCLERYGDAHPDVATCVNDLAVALQHKGDYATAELLLRKALVVYRSLLGDEHLYVATGLNNLAGLLHAKGAYASAEPLFRRTLAMLRRLLGDDHPTVPDSLNNLAALLRDMGDYATAEPLYRRALMGYRALLGDEHPRIAASLNNLAHLLYTRGDYASAEPLYREALALDRRLLGDEHPHVAGDLNNLAALLEAKGDHAAAEPIYREALALRRKSLGAQHPAVALSLNNLASVLDSMGEGLEAESLHREALVLQRKLLGNHPDVALSLNNLAVLLAASGDFDAAQPLHREAFAMRRRLLGNEHADVMQSLLNLAALLRSKDDYAGAEPILLEAADIFERIRLRVSTLGGLERTGVLETPLPALVSVQVRLGRSVNAWQRLEAHFARGLLDEIALRQARPLTPAERDREASLAGQLSSLDERISALLATATSADRDELLGKLRRQRETLQAEFVQFAAAMQEKYGVAAGEVYDLESVQHSLPADAALVAWLDMKGEPHAANPNGEHWACVVRNAGEPLWVELRGSGADGRWNEDDDRLPERVRTLLADRTASSEVDSALAALARQRIAPIAPQLAGVQQLIILPAGWMAGIPVETLIDDYTMSYAPSATMHAWLVQERDQGSNGTRDHEGATLLALGDPTFVQPPQAEEPPTAPPEHGVLLAMVQPGSNAGQHGLQRGDVLLRYDGQELSGPADLGPAIQASAAKHEEVPVEVWRAGETLNLQLAPGQMGVRPAQQPAAEGLLAMRHMDDVLVRTRGAAFAALPATRGEVKAISQVFGPKATVLLGSAASEQRLDELARSGDLKRYRYLHFATHGVLDDERAMNSALILSQDNLPDPYEQVLAEEEVYDGRLTAEQIVRTWKLDADLVTLSACQTALGKASGGEGFLGFSQALLVAGARSLVLSLWKVDDTATALLMTRFYENLLGTRGGEPMIKAAALREAKMWLRSLSWDEVRKSSGMTAEEFENYAAARGLGDRRVAPRGELQEQAPYAHPYYWAAFILIGDPE